MRPRKGDVVLASDMRTTWEVTRVESTCVRVQMLHGKRRRTIMLDSMEAVDSDEGLWQEVVR